MPIYEFACESCGNEFERIQSFSDTSVPGCPVCESDQVVRQLGRPAIHFKGSGWYINDSKKASKGSANGSSDGAADGSSTENGKEAGSADGKPAAKKEAKDTSASASSTSSSTSSAGTSSAGEPAKSAA